MRPSVDPGAREPLRFLPSGGLEIRLQTDEPCEIRKCVGAEIEALACIEAVQASRCSTEKCHVVHGLQALDLAEARDGKGLAMLVCCHEERACGCT